MSFTPIPNPLPVSGPLTDAELRATAVPVSGPLTDAELRATAVPVSGPVTDAELRASPVDTHLLEPETGFHVRMTPLGDIRAVEPYRLVGSMFGAAIDANSWTATTNGAGSAAAAANEVATLTSGTANNGYGQIVSVRSARFIFAHPHVFRCIARLPDTTEANNTRRFGAFSVSTATPQNGFCFEFDGTGALTVAAYKGASVSYSQASGGFNGAVSSYAIDTNCHAFEIIYFAHGAWFYIDGVFIHKITPTTAPMVNSYTLPITAHSVNSGSGTESSDLEIWSANIVRLGRDLTNPMSYYFAAGQTAGTTIKTGSGTIRKLVVSQVSANSAITVYDNTGASGTILWTSGSLPALTQPFYIDFDGMNFSTGLTFVVATSNCSLVFIYE